MKPTLVLTAGDFGHAAGERLAAMLQADGLHVRREALVAAAEPARLKTLVAEAAAIAVMAWRPYVEAFRRIDDACHTAGTPWTLAEWHGTRLTCGPVVVPGHGPCYHCYHRRWASHHPAPEREMVIERAYARDDALGLPGYVQPLVEVAAAAAREYLAAPAKHAGRLRLLDVLSGTVQETAVLGIHACPRCGLKHEGPAGTRFVQRLQPAVEELLQ
jgi:bacteriocin biosynthesis cyclodehydratase domain-containing protein